MPTVDWSLVGNIGQWLAVLGLGVVAIFAILVGLYFVFCAARGFINGVRGD